MRLRALRLALAAALLAGCSGPPEPPGAEEGVMLSLEDVLAKPPLREFSGPVQVWSAEKASDLAVYYVRSSAPQVGPVRPSDAALRIVLLKGRAQVRVGDIVKDAPSGAYAVVPPGTEWGLRRLGAEPMVFSLLVSPPEAALPELLRGAP